MNGHHQSSDEPEVYEFVLDLRKGRHCKYMGAASTVCGDYFFCRAVGLTGIPLCHPTERCSHFESWEPL